MKLTKNIKKKLMGFQWKYISEIRDGIWEILDPNCYHPTKPFRISDECVCYWDDRSEDHPHNVPLKNILIFDVRNKQE